MSNSPDDILYSPISADEKQPEQSSTHRVVGDWVPVPNGGSVFVSHGVDADPEWIVNVQSMQGPVAEIVNVTWQCDVQQTITCHAPPAMTGTAWVPSVPSAEWVIVCDDQHYFTPVNTGEVKSS